MRAHLYGMTISHAANAARLMLEHKGIEHRTTLVAPGLQAVRIRLAGFHAGTVPALEVDGRKALGTRRISRLLDEVRPDPPLFPRDPTQRQAVQEAEAWGEEVLQPLPRRLLRHAMRNDPGTRVTFARLLGVPLPAVAARLAVPSAVFYARREDAASLERIKADWAATPGHLDHVDQLVQDGTIGGEELNAADFQIATTVRVMSACADYAPLLEGRPCARLALRVWPEYPFEVPSLLPAAARTAA